MSNIYEQMLLTDKEAMETKISNLLEDKLNGNADAEAELNLISKVIDFRVNIEDTCCFEYDYPSISGKMSFDSLDEYEEREDYFYADDASRKGVEWNECYDGGGSFSWDGCPEVSVEVRGLTEDASEEAKTLWDAQSEEQERQEQLAWKRQRLELAQKELLELQAELSAAEATA